MKIFSACWTEELGKAIDKVSLEPYPIECHGWSEEFKAIQSAINQGIDSHLRAIFFAHLVGDYGKERIEIEPGSLSVLVRRLLESDDEASQSLASGICETLGIELV